jgi:hypothetical protein
VGQIRDAEGAGPSTFVATVVTITVTASTSGDQLPADRRAGGPRGHVLFGGVFMLGAMVMFMLFLGRSSRWLASLFAGIGFGPFARRWASSSQTTTAPASRPPP